MRDIRLALATGVDIPLPECQLIFHQPKLKEIGLIGEKDFLTGVQCLYLNKNLYSDEDKVLLENISNFQIFMKVISDPRAIDKKENVLQVLQLIFPNYTVQFLPASIIFAKEGSVGTVDENNFDAFQNLLSEVFCLKTTFGNSGFNPAGKRAEDIAKKLQKARQAVAKDKGEENASAFVTYMSCLSIALQIPITQISDYTMFQLYDALERYGLWVSWDVDLRARLAGGKPEEKQENWMKHIH